MTRPEYSSSPAERAMCPVCGRGPFLITRKGRLRTHSNGIPVGSGHPKAGQNCPGRKAA